MNWEAKWLRTEVKTYRGKPTVFVDGKPRPALFSSQLAHRMGDFIDAGFEVFDTHPSICPGWYGPDQYDYTLTDEQIEEFLSHKRDALLIVRFWMGYTGFRTHGPDFLDWWAEENPREVAQFYSPDEKRHRFPSYASSKWRKEAAEALGRVIAHLEEKYHDRIFAYVPGAGSCGEWFQTSAFDLESNQNPADYSEPMKSGFQKFVEERYRDLDELNKVWGSRFASFAEIQLPTPDQRRLATFGSLRDPAQERQVIDFYDYYNGLVADMLVDWAKVAKDACDRQKIIMAFFGYLWTTNERHSLARSGHTHLSKVLSSPDVDAIVAPYIYDFRHVGGVVSSQTLTTTVSRAGKLLINEMDPPTSLKTTWSYRAYSPKTHEESIGIMRRDTTYNLTRGIGGWYMDLYDGAYSHPRLIEGLQHAREIGEEHWLQAGESVAEVAVLVAEKSSHYFREGDPFLGALWTTFKVWQLERMGLPFDELLVSELDDPAVRDYKLYIIPDAVALSDYERRLVKQKCCQRGQTVVWCYGAGVLTDRAFSLEAMGDLVGMEIGADFEPGELVVRIDTDDHPLLQGLPEVPITYGTNGSYPPNEKIKEQACLGIYPDSEQGFRVSPRFWVNDAGADCLGTLEGVERPGLAIKRSKDWTSIFSSAPLLPKEILRDAARDAGCHVYTDFPGQLMACRGYVGFYAHATGQCTIHLPGSYRVRELFSGESLGQGKDRVELAVKEGSAFLLRLESD